MGNQGKYSRRTKSPSGFALIEREVLTGQAWKNLKGSSTKLYVYMRSIPRCGLKDAVKVTFKLSYETMIRQTGLSRQTIRHSLIELENLGFIDFKNHGGLKSGGLSSNEYSISQRFIKFDSPLFERGKEKKSKNFDDRGFGKVWKTKKELKQVRSIKTIPEQSAFCTKDK